MSILVADRLAYTYDRVPAVVDLSLRVQPGEIVALLGPNGSGKTTTLSMLTGQLQPRTGTIHIDGHALAGEGLAARRQMSFVPDRPDVYEYLTGRQYVRFVAGLYGLGAREADRRAERWWARFDLVGARDALLRTYSHGMRQRAVLVAALTHDPRLFILDEPIVGLDPESARTLRTVMREHARAGGGVLFSTHLLSVAAVVADRLVLIQHGRVRAEGTVETLRTLAGLDGSHDLEDVFFRLLEADGAAGPGSAGPGSAGPGSA